MVLRTNITDYERLDPPPSFVPQGVLALGPKPPPPCKGGCKRKPTSKNDSGLGPKSPPSKTKPNWNHLAKACPPNVSQFFLCSKVWVEISKSSQVLLGLSLVWVEYARLEFGPLPVIDFS